MCGDARPEQGSLQRRISPWELGEQALPECGIRGHAGLLLLIAGTADHCDGLGRRLVVAGGLGPSVSRRPAPPPHS